MNKAQKKALRKLAPMFIAVIFTVAISLAYIWHPWMLGLPLDGCGWEYDEELTNTYINDTFEGEIPISWNFKVYVESDVCSSCSRQIRLYSRDLTSSDWWTLESEGYVDGEGNMFWT